MSLSQTPFARPFFFASSPLSESLEQPKVMSVSMDVIWDIPGPFNFADGEVIKRL